MVKNPPANAGDIRDADSIPGLGRSPGGGHGNPLQYSCLENPTDRGVWLQRVGHNWRDLACTHAWRSLEMMILKIGVSTEQSLSLLSSWTQISSRNMLEREKREERWQGMAWEEIWELWAKCHGDQDITYQASPHARHWIRHLVCITSCQPYHHSWR